MTYFDEMKRAMEWLAEKSDTLFLGQAVGFPGTAMSNTLTGVVAEKKLEFPVAEEMQLGVSLGMALHKFVPISIFPRWNFFLLAINQLVNHIDKYPLMSDYTPKVIIRTGIGSVNPLDPQWQHKGDFTKPIEAMLKTVKVVRLDTPEMIFPAYEEAYNREGSTIICEVSDFYDEKFREAKGSSYEYITA
jgi:pyruvate/2-oxoglutarate/acetoin dehydrogenase E1 component